MGCSLEPVVWVLRGGDGHEKLGDPFTITGTVVKCDNDTVHIYAIHGGGLLAHMKYLWEHLRGMGFKEVISERIKKDGTRMMHIPL